MRVKKKLIVGLLIAPQPTNLFCVPLIFGERANYLNKFVIKHLYSITYILKYRNKYIVYNIHIELLWDLLKICCKRGE